MNVTRRQFLHTSAAVCAAAALPRWARAAEDSRKAYGGFIMGLQSYSLRGMKVEPALEHIKRWNLGSVEMFSAHLDPKGTPEQLSAMREKTESLGIKLLSHGVNRFTKDHEANRKLFEFAKGAGIRNLTADPTEDAFDSLDKLCTEYNVRIAIHNHGPGARYNKVNDVLTAIKGRNPLIGACADLGHYIRSSEDPVRVINLLEGRLFGVHLKDFAEQQAKTKGVILGRGHLDIVGVFKALKKVNFPDDACLALEYEENPQDPILDIEACLAAASEGAQKAAAG